MDLVALQSFIVAAKRATYVGSGSRAASTRTGSHDIVFSDGALSCRDGYFSGTDFLGQEVVWTDVAHFSGRETISVSGAVAYALDYFGGLVKRSWSKCSTLTRAALA